MRNSISLLLWIIALEGMGYLIGWISGGENHLWYQELTRTRLTPPGTVFGIAWSILYAMIAISGWRLFQGPHAPQLGSARFFFIVQLLLNWCWSPIFFKFQAITTAFIFVLLILAFTVATIAKSYRTEKLGALLLIPYVAWLCFASYLNGYIVVHNSTLS